jgi:hypothetical protein
VPNPVFLRLRLSASEALKKLKNSNVGRVQPAPKLDSLVHALDVLWTNKKLRKARQTIKQRGLHEPYQAA